MKKCTLSKAMGLGLAAVLSASFTSSYANVYQLNPKSTNDTQKTLEATPPEVLNNPVAEQGGYNVDPYEKFNRGIFEFNKVFMGLFIEPVAYIYTNGVWSPVQRGVSNVYNNISTVTTLPNDLLQGKVKYFFNDFWRLVINSTIGIGGIFDVAKHMGLKPHQTDFGMTLATWGAKRSKFLMLPIFGPTTFRDGFAIPFNIGMSPYPYFDSNAATYGIAAGKQLDLQARLLPAYKMMREAFDPYVFLRNGYLQARNAQIKANTLPLSEFNPNDETDSGLGGSIFSEPSETDGMITADGSSTTAVPNTSHSGSSKTKPAAIDKNKPTANAGGKTGKA